jgi:hypothetical protein
MPLMLLASFSRHRQMLIMEANPNNGRLTLGYILKIGTGTISWSLKLQTIVALSTTEAEYVAACFGAERLCGCKTYSLSLASL